MFNQIDPSKFGKFDNPFSQGDLAKRASVHDDIIQPARKYTCSLHEKW